MVSNILSILILFVMLIFRFLSKSRSKENHWLSTILFFAAFVPISDLCFSSANVSNKDGTLFLIGTIFLYSSCFFYYNFLNFSFYSSNLFIRSKFWNRFFPIISLVPVIVTYVVVWLFHMSSENSKIVMIIWEVLYSLLGCFLLTAALFKKEKKHHIKVFLYVVPTVLYLHALNEYAYLTDNLNINKYESLILIYLFVVFVTYLFKEGYIGERIKLEMSKMQGNVTTLNMTTLFLTHDIKNEIVKMEEMIQQIEKNTDPENEELKRLFSYINNSKLKIDKMFGKMKKASTKKIVLDKNKYPLGDFINHSLQHLTYGEKQREMIKTNIDEKKIVFCDLDYMSNVISNLLDNAYEALKGNGEIELNSSFNHKFCILEIKDNGPGINKEDLTNIVKPFFTTKTSGNNMGLGLTYCYNILKMCGGEMNIQSEIGKGTSIHISMERGDVL